MNYLKKLEAMVLKMPLLLKLNKYIPTLALLSFAALLNVSCTSKIELNNQRFLDEYGSKVDSINKSRARAVRKIESPYQEPQDALDANWATPSKRMGIDGAVGAQSAYIDTSKFKIPEPAGEFFPNLETFMRGKEMQNNIPEIFDVSYREKNYPESYKKRYVSFDDIEVPTHDYFGIKSTLNKKQYNMIDHKVLQKNIDYLGVYLDADTKDINLTLLREKEEIRKKKLAKLVLGEEDVVQKESDENDTEKEIEGQELDANSQDATNDDSSTQDDLPSIPNQF